MCDPINSHDAFAPLLYVTDTTTSAAEVTDRAPMQDLIPMRNSARPNENGSILKENVIRIDGSGREVHKRRTMDTERRIDGLHKENNEVNQMVAGNRIEGEQSGYSPLVQHSSPLPMTQLPFEGAQTHLPTTHSPSTMRSLHLPTRYNHDSEVAPSLHSDILGSIDDDDFRPDFQLDFSTPPIETAEFDSAEALDVISDIPFPVGAKILEATPVSSLLGVGEPPQILGTAPSLPTTSHFAETAEVDHHIERHRMTIESPKTIEAASDPLVPEVAELPIMLISDIKKKKDVSTNHEIHSLPPNPSRLPTEAISTPFTGTPAVSSIHTTVSSPLPQPNTMVSLPPAGIEDPLKQQVESGSQQNALVVLGDGESHFVKTEEHLEDVLRTLKRRMARFDVDESHIVDENKIHAVLAFEVESARARFEMQQTLETTTFVDDQNMMAPIDDSDDGEPKYIPTQIIPDIFPTPRKDITPIKTAESGREYYIVGRQPHTRGVVYLVNEQGITPRRNSWVKPHDHCLVEQRHQVQQRRLRLLQTLEKGPTPDREANGPADPEPRAVDKDSGLYEGESVTLDSFPVRLADILDYVTEYALEQFENRMYAIPEKEPGALVVVYEEAEAWYLERERRNRVRAKKQRHTPRDSPNFDQADSDEPRRSRRSRNKSQQPTSNGDNLSDEEFDYLDSSVTELQFSHEQRTAQRNSRRHRAQERKNQRRRRVNGEPDGSTGRSIMVGSAETSNDTSDIDLEPDTGRQRKRRRLEQERRSEQEASQTTVIDKPSVPKPSAVTLSILVPSPSGSAFAVVIPSPAIPRGDIEHPKSATSARGRPFQSINGRTTPNRKTSLRAVLARSDSESGRVSEGDTPLNISDATSILDLDDAEVLPQGTPTPDYVMDVAHPSAGRERPRRQKKTLPPPITSNREPSTKFAVVLPTSATLSSLPGSRVGISSISSALPPTFQDSVHQSVTPSASKGGAALTKSNTVNVGGPVDVQVKNKFSMAGSPQFDIRVPTPKTARVDGVSSPGSTLMSAKSAALKAAKKATVARRTTANGSGKSQGTLFDMGFTPTRLRDNVNGNADSGTPTTTTSKSKVQVPRKEMSAARVASGSDSKTHNYQIISSDDPDDDNDTSALSNFDISVLDTVFDEDASPKLNARKLNEGHSRSIRTDKDTKKPQKGHQNKPHDSIQPVVETVFQATPKTSTFEIHVPSPVYRSAKSKLKIHPRLSDGALKSNIEPTSQSRRGSNISIPVATHSQRDPAPQFPLLSSASSQRSSDTAVASMIARMKQAKAARSKALVPSSSQLESPNFGDDELGTAPVASFSASIGQRDMDRVHNRRDSGEIQKSKERIPLSRTSLPASLANSPTVVTTPGRGPSALYMSGSTSAGTSSSFDFSGKAAPLGLLDKIGSSTTGLDAEVKSMLLRKRELQQALHTQAKSQSSSLKGTVVETRRSEKMTKQAPSVSTPPAPSSVSTTASHSGRSSSSFLNTIDSLRKSKDSSRNNQVNLSRMAQPGLLGSDIMNFTSSPLGQRHPQTYGRQPKAIVEHRILSPKKKLSTHKPYLLKNGAKTNDRSNGGLMGQNQTQELAFLVLWKSETNLLSPRGSELTTWVAAGDLSSVLATCTPETGSDPAEAASRLINEYWARVGKYKT